MTNGYYYNELSGKLSDGSIELRAIATVADTLTNINILTTLSSNRIRYLIATKQISFDSAKSQAEQEILKVFNIPETIRCGIHNFETLDICKAGTGNAILLAISALLQINGSTAQLSELISRISNDIMVNGEITTSSLINTLRANAANLNFAAVRSNLTTHYGPADTIPEFEKYVDNDLDGVLNCWDYQLTLTPVITTTSKPIFNWTASGLPGARYRFQISNKSDFSSIVEQDSMLITNSYTLKNKLFNDSTYYWRVLISGERQSEADWAGSKKIIVYLEPIALTISSANSVVSLHDTILLHGTATSTYGKIAKWEWDAGNTGHFVETTPDSNYIATVSSTDVPFICILKVTDDDNNTATDTAVFNIIVDTAQDFEGNVYPAIRIGNQVWTVTNLKSKVYNDGTSIPIVTDSAQWSKLTTDAYCYYENDTGNIVKFGALYNWYAVQTGKLAPAGWHVPTKIEWDTLESYIYNNVDKCVDKALAAKTDWHKESYFPNTIGNDLSKNNASGFSALPGGLRYFAGNFAYQSVRGQWWSTTTDSYGIYTHFLFCGTNEIKRYGRSYHHTFERDGQSIRLVRD